MPPPPPPPRAAARSRRRRGRCRPDTLIRAPWYFRSSARACAHQFLLRDVALLERRHA